MGATAVVIGRTEPSSGSSSGPSSGRSGHVLAGFAQVVIAVSQRARALGLVVPGFRSPVGGSGVRTLRHRPDGPPTVMVPVRGRSLRAVAADVVAGVLVVNPGSAHLEAELLEAAGFGPSRLDPAA